MTNTDVTVDSSASEIGGDFFVSVPLDEFLEMREQIEWLEALEAAGVDNWEGIDHASDIFRERLGNENGTPLFN
ncbi:hypothetical protein KGP36_03205 [Patescibacteria group bacterium]|nr:hypothetical protein [Patescibacteria group bacterium]